MIQLLTRVRLVVGKGDFKLQVRSLELLFALFTSVCLIFRKSNGSLWIQWGPYCWWSGMWVIFRLFCRLEYFYYHFYYKSPKERHVIIDSCGEISIVRPIQILIWRCKNFYKDFLFGLFTTFATNFFPLVAKIYFKILLLIMWFWTVLGIEGKQ